MAVNGVNKANKKPEEKQVQQKAAPAARVDSRPAGDPATAGAPTATAQHTTFQQPKIQKEVSMNNNSLSMLLGGVSPMNGGGHSELLERARKTIVETMVSTEGKPLTEYDVSAIASTVANLPYSAIMVSTTINTGNGILALGLPIVLVATGQARPSPREISYQGQPLTVERAPGDVWDSATNADQLNDVLAGVWSRQNVSIQHVSILPAVVVPASFDFVRKEDVRALTAAVVTGLSIRKSNAQGLLPDLQFNKVVEEGNKLANTVNFQTMLTHDLLGQPVRNEVSVITSVIVKERNQDWNREIPFVESRGFIDMTYTGVDNTVQPYQPQRPNTQRYLASQRITGFHNPTGDLTLGKVLFSLAANLTLEVNGLFAKSFLTSINSNQRNQLNDIGGLGLDDDLFGNGKLERIETRGAAFGKTELAQLMDAFFHRSMGLQVDINPDDAQAWALNDLLWQAQGSLDAAERIRDCIDNFTGGAYSARGGNGQLFDIKDMFHLGTYTGEENEDRDLREVTSYLGSVNACGKDTAFLREYQQTMADANTGEPEDVRMARRWNLIQRMCPTARLAGYGYTLQLRADAANVMVEAMTDARLNIQLESGGNMFAPNTTRGNMSAMQNYATSGLGARVQQPVATGYKGGNFGRFSR